MKKNILLTTLIVFAVTAISPMGALAVDNKNKEEKKYDDSKGGYDGREAPSINVKNQRMKRQEIIISYVYARENGWVDIHKNIRNRAGDSVGHVYVKRGKNYNVRVKINDREKAGKYYWAMLHVDRGKKWKYEYPGVDQPVVYKGKTVMSKFFVR